VVSEEKIKMWKVYDRRRTKPDSKSPHGLWPGELKKQLFDLEVKGQGPTKVITVCDTPPYGHAPTYQISLTYLERQKCYGPDKKILFKKQLFDLKVEGQGPTKVITVCDTQSVPKTFRQTSPNSILEKKILFD
jgi:hypothetical protein